MQCERRLVLFHRQRTQQITVDLRQGPEALAASLRRACEKFGVNYELQHIIFTHHKSFVFKSLARLHFWLGTSENVSAYYCHLVANRSQFNAVISRPEFNFTTNNIYDSNESDKTPQKVVTEPAYSDIRILRPGEVIKADHGRIRIHSAQKLHPVSPKRLNEQPHGNQQAVQSNNHQFVRNNPNGNQRELVIERWDQPQKYIQPGTRNLGKITPNTNSAITLGKPSLPSQRTDKPQTQQSYMPQSKSAANTNQLVEHNYVSHNPQRQPLYVNPPDSRQHGIPPLPMNQGSTANSSAQTPKAANYKPPPYAPFSSRNNEIRPNTAGIAMNQYEREQQYHPGGFQPIVEQEPEPTIRPRIHIPTYVGNYKKDKNEAPPTHYQPTQRYMERINTVHSKSKQRLDLRLNQLRPTKPIVMKKSIPVANYNTVPRQ